MDNDTIDNHTKAMIAAFEDQRGYAVNEPGFTLLFIPGPLIRGVNIPGSLAVVEVGRGSVMLDDPTRFNKFVFAKSGFSLSVGQYATSIIKRLLVLTAGTKAHESEVQAPQLQAPQSGQQGD